MLDRVLGGSQIVELVLSEDRHLEAGGERHRAGLRLEPPGEQLGEGRLAIAVGAQQRDAIVGVDAERNLPQHRLVGHIAGGDAAHGDDRRSDRPCRFGEVERLDAVLHHRRDRLHLLQRFQPRLRLSRLRRLRPEPLHEGFHVLARGLLLGARLLLQRLALLQLPLELVVAAAPEGELLLVQMHDRRDRPVQKVAVVRDDQHGVRVARHVVLEPQSAFEVEIVGGLVEEQQVGLREQHRGECDAHAPAAGKRGGGALLRRLVEAQPGQDGGGARLSRMGVDVGEPRVNLGDPVGVGRTPFFLEKGGAFGIRLQHDLDQRLVRARRFLGHLADPRALGHRDGARLGREIAGNGTEERRLAGSVAADEPRLRARRQGQRGVVDQQPSGDA